MKSMGWFVFAALAEIVGCYSFWLWLRLNRSPVWLVLGVPALLLFAWALTKVDASHAGRAYAAYGAIYIVGAILWGWFVEKSPPDRWDVAGGLICLAGSALILWGPRST
jgi:small multidrug resistance family-3 protein